MSNITKEKTTPKESAFENPEVIIDKFVDVESYVEKHTKTIGIAVLAIALVIGGYFGYRWWTQTQDEEAQKQMFAAVYYFEADSLKKALNGDGNNLGLISISEDFSGTKAGKLARFYIGTIYLKQGS